MHVALTSLSYTDIYVFVCMGLTFQNSNADADNIFVLPNTDNTECLSQLLMLL